MRHAAQLRTGFFVLACLAGSATHAPASAADIDSWVSACAAELNPVEERVVQATGLLVNRARLSGPWPDSHGGFYYQASVEPFTQTDGYVSNGVHIREPICEDSRFYGEPTIFLNARSATLVGPNLALTAPHDTNFDFSQFYVVFGLDGRDGIGPGCPAVATDPQGTIDQIPEDHLRVPAANVFEPTAQIFNAFGQHADYALLELDRSVPRQPLPVRRDGVPWPGDRVIASGHPQRMLATKIDRDAFVSGAGSGMPPLFWNLHALQGSSGGPVVSADGPRLEAVFAHGHGAATIVPDERRGCHRIVPVEPTPSMETNASVTMVAEHIPQYGLVAAPSELVHDVAVGGMLAQSASAYTLSAPATQAIQYRIGALTVTPDTPDHPTLEIVYEPPGTGSIAAGATETLTVLADASATTRCGVWDARFAIDDLTNDLVNPLRQRFEVGLIEYAVEPASDMGVQQFSAPYEARAYTLRNRRTSVATVHVSSDSDWLEVNGTGAATVSLAPKGTPGESSVVEFTIDNSAAESLPASIDHVATITFTPQGPQECMLSTAVTRTLHFTRGVVLHQIQSPIHLPSPQTGQTWGEPASVTIDAAGLGGGYCLADMDIDIAMPPRVELPQDPCIRLGTCDGTEPLSGSFERIAGALRIRLGAPDGTSSLLWAGDPLPSLNPNYVASYVVPLADGLERVLALHLDDTLSPPLGGGTLGVFAGRPASGLWTVEFANNSQAFPIDVLSHVRLVPTFSTLLCQ